MIVEPPDSPPELVADFEHRIADCGLKTDRVRIVFAAERQRIEIYVPAPSRANDETINCLLNKGIPGRYFFEEDQLRAAYNAALSSSQDCLRTNAIQLLSSQGKFDLLPKPAQFGTKAEFAQALEKLCGFAAGGAIRVQGPSTFIYPPDSSKRLTKEELRSWQCISAAFALTTLDSDREIWRDLEPVAAKDEGGASAQTH